MRKLLIVAALLATTPALADDHRYRHPQPQRQHNTAPWVAGAIGLGILGAGAYLYNQNQQRCWNEPVLDSYGRRMTDRYGNLLFETVCNY